MTASVVDVAKHERAEMQDHDNANASSILDTFRLKDGRAIGDVPIRELEGLIEQAETVREALILREVHRVALIKLTKEQAAFIEELQRLLFPPATTPKRRPRPRPEMLRVI